MLLDLQRNVDARGYMGNGFVMAWLLFGETITLSTVVGTAMTATGVALLVRRKR